MGEKSHVMDVVTQPIGVIITIQLVPGSSCDSIPRRNSRNFAAQVAEKPQVHQQFPVSTRDSNP